MCPMILLKNPPHKGASRFNIEGADTVVKARAVAAQIQARLDSRVRLVRPKLVVENELFEVHEPEYVRSFLNGTRSKPALSP